MTAEELYKIHKTSPDPEVIKPAVFYKVLFDGDKMFFDEGEAALLCARLLALLPPRTASEAVALSELIRRETE